MDTLNNSGDLKIEMKISYDKYLNKTMVLVQERREVSSNLFFNFFL